MWKSVALLVFILATCIDGTGPCTFESCPRCLEGGPAILKNLTIVGASGRSYSAPLRIARATEFWDSQAVFAQAVGILVQEKLGIEVQYVHCDDEASCTFAVSNCVGWEELSCREVYTAEEALAAAEAGEKRFPDELADIMFTSETLQESLTKSAYADTDFVYETRQVRDMGLSGYITRDGLYVSADAAARARAAGDFDLAWFPTLRNAAARGFLDPPQKLMDDGIGPEVPGCSGEGFVESAMAEHRALGWRCDASGWWLNPACAALNDSWTTDCAVILEDDWGYTKPWLYQALARSEVPVAKLMVGYDPWWELIYYRSYEVVYTWWSPDASILAAKPVRMQLMQFDDMQPAAVLKAGWSPAFEADVRLKYLLENAFMPNDGITELMNMVADAVEEGLAAGETADEFYQFLTCRWLRSREATWSEWLLDARSCAVGQTFDAAAAQCLPCPVGSHGLQFRNGSTACAPCAAGRFASAPGLTECWPCAPGSFQGAAGSSQCLPCARGSSQGSSGGERCDDCEAGRAAGEEGSSACLACGLGAWAAAGAQACEACAPDTYANTTGSEACWPCPAGFITEGRGAVKPADCICPSGTLLPLGGGGAAQCEPCPEQLECPAGSARSQLRSGAGPLRLAPGYMTVAGRPDKVYACALAGVCATGRPGSCGGGRDPTSVACGECLSGSFQSGSHCKPCSGAPSAGLMLAILGIVSFLLGSGVVALAVNRSRTLQTSRHLDLALIFGISVTTLQVLGVMGSLAIGWVEPLASLLRIASGLGMQFEDLQLPCLVKTGPAMDNLALLLPFLLCILSASATLLCKKGWRRSTDLAVELCNAVCAFCSVFFISLVLWCTRPLSCYEHPAGSGRSMRAWPSVLCFEEAPAHGSMLAQSCLVWCLVVLPFFTFFAVTTWRHPGIVTSPGSFRWRRASAVLFVKFKPSCYYSGLLLSVKSLAACLVPVVIRDDPVLQCMCLLMVLLVSLKWQQRFYPWASRLSNVVDGIVTVLVIGTLSLGMVNAGLVTNKESLRLVGSVTCGIFGAIVLICFIFALLKAVIKSREYDFFLCHHKQGAAARVRLLKMLLDEQYHFRSFLDSDHLRDLDCLFDVVGSSVVHLVVVLTALTLTRPWCAGEIATAHTSGVNTIALVADCFRPPTEPQLGDLGSYIDLPAVLLKSNISFSCVREAFRELLGSKVHKILMAGAGACGEQLGCIAAELRREALKSRTLCDTVASQTRSFSELAKPSNDGTAPVGDAGAKDKEASEVLLSADLEDSEACATLGIISRLLPVYAPGIPLHDDFRDDTAEHLARSAKRSMALVVLLTAGTLQSAPQCRAIVAAVLANEEEPSFAPIPVSTPGFTFPTQARLAEIVAAAPALSRAGQPQVLRFFRLIASAVSPHESRGVLGAQVEALVARLPSVWKKARSEGADGGSLAQALVPLFEGGSGEKTPRRVPEVPSQLGQEALADERATSGRQPLQAVAIAPVHAL